MSDRLAPFRPASGLSNSHLMTLAPLLLPRRFPATDTTGERLFIEVEPDNQVLVHLHRGEGARADSLIVVLHGLESSAEAPYVKGVSEKAIYDGFSVARMNMRNCGGTSHLATTLYNAGMSSDLLYVARELVRRYHFKDVFFCGFSLGGNVALKAAGEYGLKPDIGLPLAGVCAVCPPIDLDGCVKQMEKGVNRIYEKNFVLSLKMRIYEKARHFPGRFDLKKLRQVRTVRHFDSAFTAPDAGYGSAEEYYEQASSQLVLDKITCPALIIAAQDDPLVPFSSFIAMDEKIKKSGLILLAPPNGGHVSFIHNETISAGLEKSAPADPFWAEWQALEFFKQHTTGGVEA